jgi:hypothetical protein
MGNWRIPPTRSGLIIKTTTIQSFSRPMTWPLGMTLPEGPNWRSVDRLFGGRLVSLSSSFYRRHWTKIRCNRNLSSLTDIRETSGLPAESDRFAAPSMAARQRNKVSFLVCDARRRKSGNQEIRRMRRAFLGCSIIEWYAEMREKMCSHSVATEWNSTMK